MFIEKNSSLTALVLSSRVVFQKLSTVAIILSAMLIAYSFFFVFLYGAMHWVFGVSESTTNIVIGLYFLSGIIAVVGYSLLRKILS